MSDDRPLLTTVRTLQPGPLLRPGSTRGYRSLAVAGGEPHVLRTELVPERSLPAQPARRRPLACFGHVTDLQLADVQSPARFEFIHEVADPRLAHLLPMHRPQESLTARAVDATVRALNGLAGGPVTSAPLGLVLTTGDAIDNAQWNELQLFLALFEGGTARPDSGGPAYEGVQAGSWPGSTAWDPDARRADAYGAGLGFPQLPGLLADALAAFDAPGLRVPWLGCFGNHEALVQGVAVITPELERSLVGGSKAAGLPELLDRDRALDAFARTPESFFGAALPVTPDRGRRPVTRSEFVSAHFSARSRPHGHGFGEANLRAGTAYYSYDDGPVRYVCLDTNCLAGGCSGCLDADQLAWLERELQGASSSWLAPDGSRVSGGTDDRLVVLFSHHGSDRMAPDRGHPGPAGVPLLGAPDLLALLHRYPNVVLWVNGHTHHNTVRPHPGPGGAGFWEIATCAVVDWPSQSRVLELTDNGDGTLSVLTTMLDHGGVVVPAFDGLRDGAWLAGVHRELAANVPGAGFDSARGGALTDRNVDLRLAAPFPLAGLTC